jgi:copper chaperone CopZ
MRLLSWGLTALALGVAVALGIGPALRHPRPWVRPAPVGALVTLEVTGPDCLPCAARIETELLRAPHVIDARLDYASRRATVWLSVTRPDDGRLIEAVRHAGFQATVVSR